MTAAAVDVTHGTAPAETAAEQAPLSAAGAKAAALIPTLYLHLAMKHEFTPTGLRITADEAERAALRERRDERVGVGQHFGTSADEAEALESLIANSELYQLAEGDTADLTSAPMLGILGEEATKEHSDFEPNFGIIETGHDGRYTMAQAIVARFAYMNYQVRSFLTDLIEQGYADFQGGFAEAEVSATAK